MAVFRKLLSTDKPGNTYAIATADNGNGGGSISTDRPPRGPSRRLGLLSLDGGPFVGAGAMTPFRSSRRRRESVVADVTVKILLMGKHGCGKTSLVRQWVDATFDTGQLPTVGADRFVKYLMDDTTRKNIKVEVWDASGRPACESTVAGYARAQDGVMVVYDVTDQSSFDRVAELLEAARAQPAEASSSPASQPRAILRTRSSLKDSRPERTSSNSAASDKLDNATIARSHSTVSAATAGVAVGTGRRGRKHLSSLSSLSNMFNPSSASSAPDRTTLRKSRSSDGSYGSRSDASTGALCGVSPPLAVVVVGNRIDLSLSRAVEADVAKRQSSQWQAPVVETSARDPQSVNQAFKTLVAEVLLQRGLAAQDANLLRLALRLRPMPAYVCDDLTTGKAIQGAASPLDIAYAHRAAAYGSIAALHMMMTQTRVHPSSDAKDAVDLRDRRGRTPLHVAVAAGHMAMVKRLLREGADVFAMDHDDLAPAEVATDSKIRDYLQKVAARVEHDECRVLGERPLTTANVVIVGSDAQSVLAVHSLLTETSTPSFPSPHQPLHHTLPLSSLSLQQPPSDTHTHTYTHTRTPTHTTPASTPTHTPARTPTNTPKSVFGSMASGVRRGFKGWSTPRRKSGGRGGGGGENEGNGGALSSPDGVIEGGSAGGAGGGGEGTDIVGGSAPALQPSDDADDDGIIGRSGAHTAPQPTDRYETEHTGSVKEKEKEEVTCVALLQRVHRSRASDGSNGGADVMGGGEEEEEDGDFCGLARPSDVRVHKQCASDLRLRITTWSPDATPWALQLLPAPPAAVYVVAMDMSSPDLTTTRQIIDMIHAAGASKQGEKDILIVGTYPEATEQPPHVLSRSAAQRLMGTAGKEQGWTRIMEWPHAGSKSAACAPPVVLPVPAEPTQGPSTDLARHLLRQGVAHAVRELTVLRQDHPFVFLLLQREIQASPSPLLPLSALRQLADSIATTYTRQPRMHAAALMCALDFLTASTMDLHGPTHVSRKAVMAMVCGETAETQSHESGGEKGVVYVRSDAGARLLSLLMEVLPAATAHPSSDLRSAAHTLLSTGSLPRQQLLHLINSTLPCAQTPALMNAPTTTTTTTPTTPSAEPARPPSATDGMGEDPPLSRPAESSSVERLTENDMMAGLLALERMDLALCMDNGCVLMPHFALQRPIDTNARRTQPHPRSSTPAQETPRTPHADDTRLTRTRTDFVDGAKQLVCVYDFALGLPPSFLARAVVRAARVSVLRYHGFCVSAPALCDAGAVRVVGHGNGGGRGPGAGGHVVAATGGDGGGGADSGGGGHDGDVNKRGDGGGCDSGRSTRERAAVYGGHVNDGDGGVWIDGPGYHLVLQQDLDKGRIALYACVDTRDTPTHTHTTTTTHLTHTATVPHTPHTRVLPPAVASRVGLTVHAILEDTRRAYFPRRRMCLGLPADGEGKRTYDLVEVLLAAKMRGRRGQEEGEEEATEMGDDSGSGGAVSHTVDEAEHPFTSSGGSGDGHSVDSTNDVQSIPLDAYLSWATTQAAMPQSTFRPLPRIRTTHQSYTPAKHGTRSPSAAAKRSPLGVLTRRLGLVEGDRDASGNGGLLDSRTKWVGVEGRCGATGAGETVSDTHTHARDDVVEDDPWATDVMVTLRVSTPSTATADTTQYNASPHRRNSHRRTFNLTVGEGGMLAVCDTAKGRVWVLESVGPGKDGFRLRSGEAKRGYVVVGEWGTSGRMRLALDSQVREEDAAVFIARVDEMGGSKLAVVGRRGDGELSRWEVVVGEGGKEVMVAVTDDERSRASVDRCLWTLDVVQP